MAQYGFYFDNTRCTGCRTCVMACKDYKDLPQNLTFRKVYDYEGGTWAAQDNGSYTTDCFSYHVSVACNHCQVPACLAACPQSAISKDAETGIVSIDEELCTGEASCVDACPYGAPLLDEERRKAIKCNLCAERIAEGASPVCVEACPLRALNFGEVEELRATYGTDAAIAPLPSADETYPSLVIKPCPAAKQPGDTAGKVANEKEILEVAAFVR
ncbi:MAG: 4Fe-4S dicluster domain-containing protein [Coriobacteriales bacterium]|jgi:anaerobic dimethyl sulfoxide reductase subunit B (iron-sulfur subunit)|nr:4Fe-4S dicluster domain-containing protein [Coriobacteriales bacterium]